MANQLEFFKIINLKTFQDRPDDLEAEKFRDMIYTKIQEATVAPGEPVGRLDTGAA